jgi:hypothetical protein
VPGHVHHVVDPAEQPEVAVFVELDPVAGEVDVISVLGEVGLAIPLVVLEDRAEHRRDRPREHQVTPTPGPDGVALLVEHIYEHPGERFGCGSGLQRRDAGKGGDADRSGLSLPPRVDHRGLAAADEFLVPDPSFRVYRFPDASE